MGQVTFGLDVARHHDEFAHQLDQEEGLAGIWLGKGRCKGLRVVTSRRAGILCWLRQ